MTNGLEAAREKIRAVDKETAALFVRRMEAVREVAEYKYAHGLDVFDPAQEAHVLERNMALVPEEVREYYAAFLRGTMEAAKSYQYAVMAEKRAKKE